MSFPGIAAFIGGRGRVDGRLLGVEAATAPCRARRSRDDRFVLAASIGLLAAIVGPARWVLAEDRFVVRGGPADLDGPIPVVAPLTRPIAEGDYLLVEDGEPRRTYPANVFRLGDRSSIGAVLGPVRAGESRRLRLVAESPEGESGHPIRVRTIDGGLAITSGIDGKAPFTEYRVDAGPKPILYPVVGPSGVAMTRAFPMAEVGGEDRDHPHQRSFWFTHGLVNGVDFWAETPGHGSIRETTRPLAVGGRAVGVLRTTDDWLGPDGGKVCEDERLVRFWDLGSIRLIDFEITLKATAGPVVFGDTKEGAFGLRVASSMDVKRKAGGRITNASGRLDGDAWGKPSPWVDYVGPVGGKVAGVAILNHPTSFRYPTPWHVRDYGLFAANPFGSKEFRLEPPRAEASLDAGGSLTLRYRVILHDAATDATRIEGLFRGYAGPPAVSAETG